MHGRDHSKSPHASIGPKQIDNFDRLVAAMVKKHVNFSHIVLLAVGLVQLDLGPGCERAKLTFKQGYGSIESGLKNRDACADAVKPAPQIAQIEDDLKGAPKASFDLPSDSRRRSPPPTVAARARLQHPGRPGRPCSAARAACRSQRRLSRPCPQML